MPTWRVFMDMSDSNRQRGPSWCGVSVQVAKGELPQPWQTTANCAWPSRAERVANADRPRPCKAVMRALSRSRLIAMQVCFQSGRSLRTEELHRCIHAAPGQQYIVDCTVAVTAPFGDRFRTVCRYSIASVTPATAQLRIDYAMTYAKPIPGWGRAMLEPAAESGLAKNFAQFIEVLSEFIDLSDAAAPVPPMPMPTPTSVPPSPASPAAPPTPTPTPTLLPYPHPHHLAHVKALVTTEGFQRRIRTVRTMFVDDHVVDLFLPAAEVLLMSAGVSNSGDVAVRSAAAVLSTASVLLLLQLLLNVWHAVGVACQGARSVPGMLCARAHRAVDLPQSVAGVFVATVVIMAVRSLLGGIAAQVRLAPTLLSPAPVVKTELLPDTLS